MKKLILPFFTVALILSLVTPAVAQSAGPKKGNPPAGGAGKRPEGGERRMMMSSEMAKKLKLTDAQRKQIEALSKSTQEKMKKLRDGNLTPEKRRAEMQKIMTEQRNAMNKILTADQRKILEAEMKKMREQWQKGGGRQGRPGGGNRPPLS